MKAVRTIFGLVGLLIGLPLMWAGYFHQLKEHETVASWVETPCRILTWEVDITHSPSFGYTVNPSLSYEYTFSGKTYRSSNYDEATDWAVDLRDFEKEGDAARRGPAHCYVNSQNPTEASFRPARLWFPYSLIGGGCILALMSLIFLGRTYRTPQSELNLSSEDRRRRFNRKWSLRVSALLLGLAIYQGYKLETWDVIRGQLFRSQLVQTPGQVEASGITDVRGVGRNRHLTYHMAHLVYSYEHGGRRWYSDRWFFDATKINGGTLEQTRALIRAYPRGLALSCWIHPEKPWLTTLDRSLRWYFLWQLIPLGLLIGALVFLRAAWKSR